MRTDLYQLLRATGVDNIEAFPATLSVPWTKEVLDNFVAVNVIGLVSAAAVTSSVSTGVSIEAERAGGLLLFRLAESREAVVVHQRVADAVRSSEIEGMTFYEPGEWSSL
jgi:hypothetical protein